jgi:hypothetical protein
LLTLYNDEKPRHCVFGFQKNRVIACWVFKKPRYCVLGFQKTALLRVGFSEKPRYCVFGFLKNRVIACWVFKKPRYCVGFSESRANSRFQKIRLLIGLNLPKGEKNRKNALYFV